MTFLTPVIDEPVAAAFPGPVRMIHFSESTVGEQGKIFLIHNGFTLRAFMPPEHHETQTLEAPLDSPSVFVLLSREGSGFFHRDVDRTERVSIQDDFQFVLAGSPPAT